MKSWHPAIIKRRWNTSMRISVSKAVNRMVDKQKKCEECGAYPVRTYGFNSSDMSFTGWSSRVCGNCIIGIIKGE